MPLLLSTDTLPAPVSDYIQAANAQDADTCLATFANDALVNDDRREFRGKAAIGRWAAAELFAASVSMDVVEAIDLHGSIIVTARIDGTFDKTGLPDPLLLTYYFTLDGGHIVQLIIIHNRSQGGCA
ncbi:nuclear transport factor 2 family protein [Emcibacter sp. SYSU 3D8]|uniref:nuclear transport factor 2 family protein n=1 Tax=Emcibacter sp. SYSU 3D8 TaxID=3133969 RepID=UPI0031FEF08D